MTGAPVARFGPTAREIGWGPQGAPDLQPPGPCPRLDLIPVDRLCVDSAYQRAVVGRAATALIRTIAAAWSWARCGALIVAPRGDLHEIIDGQHRAAAALLRGDIPALPAVIVEADTPGAAAAFVAVNADRRGVSAVERLHARIACGDPVAAEIEAAVRAAGARLVRGRHELARPAPDGPPLTAAVRELERLHQRGGPQGVRAAVAVGARHRRPYRPLPRRRPLPPDAGLTDGGH